MSTRHFGYARYARSLDNLVKQVPNDFVPDRGDSDLPAIPDEFADHAGTGERLPRSGGPWIGSIE